MGAGGRSTAVHPQAGTLHSSRVSSRSAGKGRRGPLVPWKASERAEAVPKLCCTHGSGGKGCSLRGRLPAANQLLLVGLHHLLLDTRWSKAAPRCQVQWMLGHWSNAGAQEACLCEAKGPRKCSLVSSISLTSMTGCSTTLGAGLPYAKQSKAAGVQAATVPLRGLP